MFISGSILIDFSVVSPSDGGGYSSIQREQSGEIHQGSVQQPLPFPPNPMPTNAVQPPRPSGPASGGPVGTHGSVLSQGYSTSQMGHAIADRADGVSMPAMIGYVTAGLILIFGAGGTLFSDLPGPVKKGVIGGYAAGSVSLVLMSSFVDSHHRIAMK